jgi:hypothetical protein
VLASEAFAKLLEQGPTAAPQADKPDQPPPPDEVEEWLQIFKNAELERMKKKR